MTDVYHLPFTVEGLRLVLGLTLSLRAAGYTTRVTETALGRFPVYRVTATPATRLSRKARGYER